MRRVMLTLALTLWASHSEASILFTPDFFTLEVRGIFNATNTDTFCWQCGDLNPSNDLLAVFQTAPSIGGGGWPDFLVYSAGQMNLRGTATDYSGLEANLGLRFKLTAYSQSLPESLVSPSVKFFTAPGRLIGVDGGEALVLECCTATTSDGIHVHDAFFPPSPYVVPPGGTSDLLALEIFLPPQIEYTPIPEPTSLLLLGSAVAAATLRRYRVMRKRSS